MLRDTRGRKVSGGDAPGGEHDDVRVDRAPVLELEARLREPPDAAVVLQLDLPVDQQLRRADVYLAPRKLAPSRHAHPKFPEMAAHRGSTLLRAVWPSQGSRSR